MTTFFRSIRAAPGSAGGGPDAGQNKPGADISRTVYVGLLALAALIILTGNFTREFTADTYLLSLCSLQTWQPYFWGQNRYGMAVPLLVGWVRDYEANLLSQMVLQMLFTAGAFYFAGRLFFPKAPRRFAIWGVLAFAVFLPVYARQMFNGQPYAAAVFLTLAGQAALGAAGLSRFTRWLIFGVCALVALYINVAGFPLALGLLTLGAWCTRSRPIHWAAAMAVLGGAFLINLWLAAQSPFAATSGAGANPYDVFRAAKTHFDADHSAWDWFMLKNRRLVLFFFVVGVWAGFRLWRGADRESTRAAVGLLALGVALLALFAAVPWVAEYYFAPRYFVPSAMLLAAAVAALAADTLRRESLRHLASGALLVALGAGFSPGSYWRVRDARLAELNPAIKALEVSGASMFFGEFEECWPVVFWANVRFQETGSDRVCHGLSVRSIAQLGLILPRLSEPGAICLRAPASRFSAFMSEKMAGPFIETARSGDYVIGNCRFAPRLGP